MMPENLATKTTYAFCYRNRQFYANIIQRKQNSFVHGPELFIAGTQFNSTQREREHLCSFRTTCFTHIFHLEKCVRRFNCKTLHIFYLFLSLTCESCRVLHRVRLIPFSACLFQLKCDCLGVENCLWHVTGKTILLILKPVKISSK